MQYDTSVDERWPSVSWSPVGGGKGGWLCFNHSVARCEIFAYARVVFSLSLFLVLLRCDIFQGPSVSVGVSMKKSVVGSVSVFTLVH